MRTYEGKIGKKKRKEFLRQGDLGKHKPLLLHPLAAALAGQHKAAKEAALCFLTRGSRSAKKMASAANREKLQPAWCGLTSTY